MPNRGTSAVSERPNNRRASGFTRVVRVEEGGPERVFSIQDEEKNDNGRARPGYNTSNEEQLTKNGTPDRRFKGHREDPTPDVNNPNYRQARTGGTMGDTHVTINGKPDLRFKENRGMSEDEVMETFATNLADEYDIKR